MATSSLKTIYKTAARAEQAIILLMPVLLFFIPLHKADSGFTFCIFKNIFGTHCPGCGMTHAIISALHLHFADAWNYNRLVVVVLPLLAYIWCKYVFQVVINKQ